jgi:hypothetical protein
MALVTGLPDDSATVRVLSNGWSVERELAASAVEQIHDMKRVLVMVNSSKGSSAPEPLRIPRPEQPDQQDREKPMSTPADVVTFFTSPA